MAVYQADAIVIRSREYGESDRLITLFSREKGKLEAVAKGVRKPKSTQRGGTQLFTYADFLLYRGKTLDTVNQAQPRENFIHLWDDFDRTITASAMVELLDISTVREQPDPELFTLTLSFLFCSNILTRIWLRPLMRLGSCTCRVICRRWRVVPNAAETFPANRSI